MEEKNGAEAEQHQHTEPGNGREAATGKKDGNGSAPSKKDTSDTNSSNEPMAENIPKDGSMPRY